MIEFLVCFCKNNTFRRTHTHTQQVVYVLKRCELEYVCVCVRSHNDSFPADFELLLCLEFVFFFYYCCCVCVFFARDKIKNDH